MKNCFLHHKQENIHQAKKCIAITASIHSGKDPNIVSKISLRDKKEDLFTDFDYLFGV